MIIAFFDTKPYDVDSFNKINHDGFIYKFFDVKLSIETAPLAAGADAVCIFVNDDVNKEVIDYLYKIGVKVLALRCAGYNNVDVKAAFGKIHIVHVPAYSPYAVAEHAMALLLTSVRRIHKAYNRVRDFNFSLNGLTGFDLNGKTIGVIGTGKIGKIFSRICLGFGMHVLAYDKYPSDENLEYVSLDRLFAESDIISLHCPLNDETFHLLNEESFNKMKDGVVILNTSRGALIDSEALLLAIKKRKVGAACLDVYEEEADIFFQDYSGHIIDDDTIARLISMPNVLITSHQAFLTEEALKNIAEETISNIKAALVGNYQNELCYRCGKVEECKKGKTKKCF